MTQQELREQVEEIFMGNGFSPLERDKPHQVALFNGLLSLITQREKAARIDELEIYLGKVEAFRRKPGTKIADDFGSAGAGIEREGIKTYLKGRIAQLKERHDE